MIEALNRLISCGRENTSRVGFNHKFGGVYLFLNVRPGISERLLYSPGRHSSMKYGPNNTSERSVSFQSPCERRF